ncbi:MAG: AraC family transcriptional regulator [Myxococcota bacterium]
MRDFAEEHFLRYQHRRQQEGVVQVSEAKVVGGSGVGVAHLNIGVAYDDVALPNWVLIRNRVDAATSASVDVGAGAFVHPGHAGTAHVCAEGVAGRYSGRGPFALEAVSIPGGIYRAQVEEFGLGGADLGPLHAGPFFDPMVNYFVSSLFDETTAGGARGELFADYLVMALTRALLRRAGYLTVLPKVARLDGTRLTRLSDFVRARLAEPLELADLAAVVGMTPMEFARAFKAAMGQSPWQYVIALRCERAAELLARFGHPASLAFVAAQCGFHDQSHLTRHFKRQIGVTPGAFRKSLRVR